MELSFVGILIIIALFLTFGTGKNSQIIVAFLSVVLLSMIVLNWSQIRPILIKDRGQTL